MTQARLNHLAILHVQQEMTDNIDLVTVARDCAQIRQQTDHVWSVALCHFSLVCYTIQV